VRARVNGFRFLELVPSLGRFIVSFRSNTVFERVKNSLSRVRGTHPNFSGNPPTVPLEDRNVRRTAGHPD
jgi:hypothetical protein